AGGGGGGPFGRRASPSPSRGGGGGFGRGQSQHGLSPSRLPPFSPFSPWSPRGRSPSGFLRPSSWAHPRPASRAAAMPAARSRRFIIRPPRKVSLRGSQRGGRRTIVGIARAASGLLGEGPELARQIVEQRPREDAEQRGDVVVEGRQRVHHGRLHAE